MYITDVFFITVYASKDLSLHPPQEMAGFQFYSAPTIYSDQEVPPTLTT